MNSKWTQLTEARESRGLTLNKAANKMGMPPSTLMSYENAMPAQIRKLIDIAKALDETPSSLLGFEVKKENESVETQPAGNTVLSCDLTEDERAFIKTAMIEYCKMLKAKLIKDEIIDISKVEAANYATKTTNSIIAKEAL